MNILLITTYFAPDSGAAAVRLTRLAKQFASRGHHVTVLTTMPHYPKGVIADAYRGKFTVTETQDGVQIVRTWLFTRPTPKILLRLISQNSFMLTAFLRGLFLARPDVVLIEAQPVFTSLAGMVLAWLKRVPYVLNVSDLWPEYLVVVGVMKESHPLYKIFKWLVNISQRGAAGIVALHKPILDSIQARIGDGKNRRVIFNAVDLKRFQPDLDGSAFRAKYELGTTEKLVSFMGTFGLHIDFETMLDAAAQFNHRDDVRFVFIGTGGQKDKVNERLAKGDLDRTKWVGWIEHSEMPLAWAATYITFWAIRDHEMYRSTLQSKSFEAMASGVPMAIAIEGITSEVIAESNAGMTVPFGDTQALVAAIDRLLGDETLRDQMAKSARLYAESHFDPERVADEYEAVLNSAIAKM